MRLSESQSTGFNIILAATGALVVAGIMIKQVYETGPLPVGSGGVCDTGFVLTVGAVLTFWSLAVIAGLFELIEGETNAE